MHAERTTALREARTRPSAFVAFYESHAETVLLFFVRRTFDVEAARDLTAETFASAFQSRRRFRGRSDDEAAAWLFGIARHQLSHYVRRGVAERRAVDRLGIQLPAIAEPDHERIVELAGLANLRDAVRDAFESLKAEQRAALQLRVIDDRPYPEVAAELGVSEPAARARVSRALRRLAGAIDINRATEVAS
jgi:RNA polymerase sigma-70 factor (ECF subfamily)